MRTRELINLPNSGHAGINALFSKAHSAGWDIDRDVDWTTPVSADDSLVDHSWGAFGSTPTFRALPERVQTYATRRALGRMLNVLQVGESVAQDVCAKLGLRLREEDYRNHAAAQGMDEARHRLVYRRFLEKMNEEPEDIDTGTEMMFDSLLAADGALELVATEQFFLESVAMDIFDGIRDHATNPLLRELLTLVTRDESRHMGFGILYVAEYMRSHSRDERIEFARRWLGQILFSATDQPGLWPVDHERRDGAGAPAAAALRHGRGHLQGEHLRQGAGQDVPVVRSGGLGLRHASTTSGSYGA